MQRKLYTSIVFSALIALMMHSSPAWAVSWKDNLNTALKEAKERRMPVMIDFYTKWCQWCKELDRNTYSDRKVNELSSSFVCVKVDAEKDIGAASKYEVRGYPTIIFLKPDGSYNSRVVGYREPARFLKSMQKALSYAEPPAGIKQDPAKDDTFQLSGIIFNKEKAPMAVINNTMIKEGGSIGRGRVTKISKDKVTLLVDGKTVTLSMD